MPDLILVVDDDDMNREVIEAFLLLAEYRVAQARDGTEGLELARRLRPDLLLLDVRLPDLSGYEVCRQLKGDPSTQAIPIILVSGYAGEDVAQTVQASGADGFLERPFTSAQLLDAVRQHLPI
ncbi:MAG: response regulator [Anaerolineae bacterium]|nr:response regulator [Anaerolineae bacterium]MDW8173018.1 response regulator [Anaerolineae bacterium]